MTTYATTTPGELVTYGPTQSCCVSTYQPAPIPVEHYAWPGLNFLLYAVGAAVIIGIVFILVETLCGKFTISIARQKARR